MLIKTYLLPLIKKYLGLFIAMTAILTLSFSLIITAVNGGLDFQNSFNSYVKDYGYPDISVTATNYIDQSIVDEIKSFNGVSDVESRVSTSVNCKVGDRPVTLKVNSYTEDSFYKFYINEEIAKTSDEINISLEKTFALNNNIKLGDYINVPSLVGNNNLSLRVFQLVQSPETVNLRVNEMFEADYCDYSLCYINFKDIKSAEEKFYGTSSDLGTQLLIRTNGEVDNEEILLKIKGLFDESSNVISDSFTKESSLALNRAKDYFNLVNIISVLVPSIIFLIMIVIVFFFLLQIIKNETRNMGILMSMGISKGKIFLLIGSFVGCISILSCVLGSVISIFALKGYCALFVSTNYIPFIIEKFSFPLLIVAFLINLASGQLATILSFIQIQKMTPFEALNDNDKLDEDMSPQRRKILGKLNIAGKVTVNAVMINKKRLLSSIFAYIACFVVIFFSLTFDATIDGLVNSLKNDRLNYDAQILVMNATEDTDNFISGLDCIKHFEESDLTYNEISFGDKSEFVTIQSIEENHQFFNLKDYKNNEVPYYSNGIVLEKSLADSLKVKRGDIVTINNVELVVQDISFMNASKVQIVSKQTFDQLNVDYYKTYLVDVDDENKLLSELYDRSDLVSYTVFSRNIFRTFEKEFNIYKVISVGLIAFSILTSAIVISFLNKASFVEQKRKISVMRILGYSVHDISIMWVAQFVIHFLISLIFSIPLGLLASSAIVNMMCSEIYSYKMIITPLSYLIDFGVMIGFYAIVHLLTIRTVSKFNIAENTRSRE